jgi:hypothetical protein
MAALKGNMRKVPVVMQDYESEAQEHADLVADNRIAELSTINDRLLVDLLKPIKDYDLTLTGYTQGEIDAMFAVVEQTMNFQPLEQNNMRPLDTITDSKFQPVTCPECGHTWTPGKQDKPVKAKTLSGEMLHFEVKEKPAKKKKEKEEPDGKF